MFSIVFYFPINLSTFMIQLKLHCSMFFYSIISIHIIWFSLTIFFNRTSSLIYLFLLLYIFKKFDISPILLQRVTTKTPGCFFYSFLVCRITIIKNLKGKFELFMYFRKNLGTHELFYFSHNYKCNLMNKIKVYL